VTIHGANDNPVATDDLGAALEAGGVDNRTPGEPATGNVLDNDTDIDRYDETKVVAAVRTGPEAGSGAGGTVGVPLKGTYGWLTLNADGSYTYVVDDSLPSFELLLAGQSVVEVFTYTVLDASGATDTAQLSFTIHGADDETPQPNVPDDSFRYQGGRREGLDRYSPLLEMQPALFVTRVVDSIQAGVDRAQPILQGSDVRKVAWPEIRSLSIGSGLGRDPTTFVHQSVVLSRTVALGREMEVQARPGRLSLGADGLLPAPTLFERDSGVLGQAPLGEASPQGEPLAWRAAPPFSAQLRAAAAALRHPAG
jgi:VCBS repeat-containing protein